MPSLNDPMTNIRRAQEFEKELDKVQRELDLRTKELESAQINADRMAERMKEKLQNEKERLKSAFNKMLQQKQAELLKEQCLTDEKMGLVK